LTKQATMQVQVKEGEKGRKEAHGDAVFGYRRLQLS